MEFFWSLVAAAVFCLVAAVIEFYVERKPRADTPFMPLNKRRRRRDKWSTRGLSRR